MNERLKELAVKAQVEHCVSHVRLQEFAELIVKDACQQLMEWRDEPFPFDESTAVWILKQHFGIKE